MSKNVLLEIRDLRVEVRGVPILSGVDMAFESGKVYAVLGPNASVQPPF